MDSVFELLPVSINLENDRMNVQLCVCVLGWSLTAFFLPLMLPLPLSPSAMFDYDFE